MKRIKFAPSGGTLHVEFRFSGPVMMFYELFVWSAGSNAATFIGRGNNDNPEDDVYPLPMPAGVNDGCKLQANVVIADPSTKGKSKYRVEMVVTQDGSDLGSDVAQGTMAKSSDEVFLFAKLVVV